MLPMCNLRPRGINKRESCNILWDMENIFNSRQSPLTERGRSTAFAPALRRGKCCRVGVRRSVRPFAGHRGRKLTPTRLAPIKSGLADLPLSGGGMTEVLHR
jgi:hypothetical protein